MRASDETDQDFKVGISIEDKRNNITSDQQSGSNPKAGTRLASFFFISLFFLRNVMHKRDDFYCNKVLLLFLPCCFILQSNLLPEPDKLSKNKE